MGAFAPVFFLKKRLAFSVFLVPGSAVRGTLTLTQKHSCGPQKQRGLRAAGAYLMMIK
jgi:hypothetical protein